MLPAEKEYDLLDEILSGQFVGHDPKAEKITELLQSFVMPVKISVPKAITGQKKIHRKKTTHYLTAELFEELGLAKEKIRDLCPGLSRSQVSKSKIVSQALRLILEEFCQKGEHSALVQKIIKSAEP